MKKKIREKLLKLWARANLIAFLMAASAIDSCGEAAVAVCAVTFVWLMAYASANDLFYKGIEL